jgi:predicted mannosyl-3-phosphoglycerate phosphatase (HAD superfamily)
MIAVFTDLDGTLLDARTYAWEAARPAINRLRERKIPWVPLRLFSILRSRFDDSRWL